MTATALRVARRELVVTLRAPVIYIVGGLFLVVQGVAFAALVGAMSDLRRPAPLGALLEGQLAGTLLTWVLELVVLALLGMRSIADDKRGGGWELLLTAQVGEGAAITGKWLAAVGVYALLWLPTLAYFAVVAAFREGGGGWDLETIACGYAGAIAIGAALLAWAIAASAATSSSLAAGALAFAVLIGIFLVGELPAVWPDLALDHPGVARVLGALSLRAIAAGFARGDIGVAASSCASPGSRSPGSRSRSRSRARVGGGGAEVRARGVATAARRRDRRARRVLAAQRHALGWDVSAAAATRSTRRRARCSRSCRDAATLTIVEPTLAALAPVYVEVGRVADRMAEVAPIDVSRVDPASVPGGAAAVARAGGRAVSVVATHGAVVVSLGDRRAVIDLLALASYDRGAVTRSRGRAARDRAGARRCARRGWRRPRRSPRARRPATASSRSMQRRDPIRRRRGASSPTACAVMASRSRRCRRTRRCRRAATSSSSPGRSAAGAGRGARAPALRRSRRRAARRGGRATTVRRWAGQHRARRGARRRRACAAEGDRGRPTARGARDPRCGAGRPEGYTDSPINRGFQRERATLWYQPRVVTATGNARALVTASPASYGERDLDHPPQRDDDDLPGPSVLAAVGARHRIVAIGSAESLTDAVLAGGVSALDLWADQAVRWLARAPEPALAIAARTPAQVRLVMTSGERTAAIATCVAGIPVAWLVIGGALVWWRRRRAT